MSEPRWVSVEDAASMLDVTPRTVMKWARENKMPSTTGDRGQLLLDADYIRKGLRRKPITNPLKKNPPSKE